MPKYTYECKCGEQRSIIRPKPPAVTPFDCAKCGKPMDRVAGAASSRMVEVLDNGLMARRVERPANAEQLYRDRARNSEVDKHKL